MQRKLRYSQAGRDKYSPKRFCRESTVLSFPSGRRDELGWKRMEGGWRKVKQQQQKHWTAQKRGRQRTRKCRIRARSRKKGHWVVAKWKKKNPFRVVSGNRMCRSDTSTQSHHKKDMKRNIKERKNGEENTKWQSQTRRRTEWKRASWDWV